MASCHFGGPRDSFSGDLKAQGQDAIDSNWSVTGYYGHIFGGDVIRGSFPGSSHFNFAFIENVLSF
jgi:hypothetical protein